MRQTVLYILLCLTLSLSAQSIDQLQKQQKQLQKEIENTNKLLNQTKSNEKATLNKLELLEQNIKTQKKLIRSLDNEINALDKEMAQLSQKRDTLQTEVEGLRADYARLVRETHYVRMQQSPLVFIFSAASFQQMVRRMRYLYEFSRYRRLQAERIQEVQSDIDQHSQMLSEDKESKQTALKNKQREQNNLARDERKQQKMLDELKKKEKDLLANLKKQQKKAEEVNKKIDDLVKKQAAKDKLTKEQQLIAGDFEKNKGRLPWPVEKGTVTGEFGKQPHPVYKEVTLDNKGLYIQAPRGSQARAVFEGEVTSCIVLNDTYAVIIQHGMYRSVYSGLSALTVKQGDKVKAKQTIGTVYTDAAQDNKTELYFQIYKNRDIENPRNWLAK